MEYLAKGPLGAHLSPTPPPFLLPPRKPSWGPPSSHQQHLQLSPLCSVLVGGPPQGPLQTDKDSGVSSGVSAAGSSSGGPQRQVSRTSEGLGAPRGAPRGAPPSSGGPSSSPWGVCSKAAVETVENNMMRGAASCPSFSAEKETEDNGLTEVGTTEENEGPSREGPPVWGVQGPPFEGEGAAPPIPPASCIIPVPLAGALERLHARRSSKPSSGSWGPRRGERGGAPLNKKGGASSRASSVKKATRGGGGPSSSIEGPQPQPPLNSSSQGAPPPQAEQNSKEGAPGPEGGTVGGPQAASVEGLAEIGSRLALNVSQCLQSSLRGAPLGAPLGAPRGAPVAEGGPLLGPAAEGGPQGLAGTGAQGPPLQQEQQQQQQQQEQQEQQQQQQQRQEEQQQAAAAWALSTALRQLDWCMFGPE
ncbi:hypothetical protein, conserved [Eimeria praecox]|uniref:Uncharacterized protein n=1 Tax=Eimeria praecox TaxID=51316 RepID=U6G4Q2_9EIME|nr:hypothetical protein, conserved [Eimeria praecox]